MVSWNTNQMNICTFGSFFAMFNACTAYFDCVAYETPWGPWLGLVTVLRDPHRDAAMEERLQILLECRQRQEDTFGYRTFCVGGRFGDVGYG